MVNSHKILGLLSILLLSLAIIPILNYAGDFKGKMKTPKILESWADVKVGPATLTVKRPNSLKPVRIYFKSGISRKAIKALAGKKLLAEFKKPRLTFREFFAAPFETPKIVVIDIRTLDSMAKRMILITEITTRTDLISQKEIPILKE